MAGATYAALLFLLGADDVMRLIWSTFPANRQAQLEGKAPPYFTQLRPTFKVACIRCLFLGLQ